MDGGQVITIQTNERVPLLILTEASVEITAEDRILLNGVTTPLDQSMLVTAPVILQIRRPVEISLNLPDGQRVLRTTAFTVGQALAENQITLYGNDFLDPPAETTITGPLNVTYIPSRLLSVFAAGKYTEIRSSAATVGEALAEGGLPLLGLDYSSPAENEPLPEDGQIRIVRVNENVIFSQKTVPYITEYQDSAEVELGQEKILQPGANGLSITRTRIRYEDGKQVNRITESESVVRSPVTSIVARGTKIVLKSATVDGVTIQYWRAIQMYSTSYSPCRSGVQGQCFNGTAGGLPLKKGVVAMYKEWFNVLRGAEVYVPGYGRAVIADLGGGFPDGRPWIDLGYSDNDWENWSGYVTVYFLAPAPAAIPYFMQ